LSLNANYFLFGDEIALLSNDQKTRHMTIYWKPSQRRRYAFYQSCKVGYFVLKYMYLTCILHFTARGRPTTLVGLGIELNYWTVSTACEFCIV